MDKWQDKIVIQKGRRIPNFEMLRVLAMWFIVVGHFFTHGVCNVKNYISLSYNGNCISDILLYGLTQSIWIVSSISVNLFVLISVFFLVESKNNKWSKLINVLLQTIFYSLSIYLLVVMLGWEDLGIFGLVKSIAVIRFGAVNDRTYWFVAQYVGLLALIPFINKGLYVLDKADYKKLLIVILLLDSSCVYLFYGNVFSGSQTLFHFVTVYIIAGYIRKFFLFKDVRIRCLLYCFCAVVFLCLCMDYAYSYIHCIKNNEEPILYLTPFNLNNNGMPLVLSVLVFAIIQKVNLRDSVLTRCIVAFAPYSFGVYLIHDNIYVRKYLWTEITHCLEISKYNTIPIAFVVSVSIFLICVCMDLLRSYFFRIVKVQTISELFVSFLSEKFDSIQKL